MARQDTQHPTVKKARFLADIRENDTAVFFAMLVSVTKKTASNSNPFLSLELRDRRTVLKASLWEDNAHYAICERKWKVGDHLWVRATHQGKWGLKFLEGRLVCREDAADGYDPDDLDGATRFNVDEMFDELLECGRSIESGSLRDVVMYLLTKNEESFKRHPAAERAHHAYRGGLLEHTLSVVKNGSMLADRYREYYADFSPPLNRDLVVAGCLLHDIGKLVELQATAGAIAYTKPGILVGHIIIGRDMLRDAAREVGGLDEELLLLLEHVILSHQYMKEWDSPKEPHFLEALLVHFADDIDAKMNMYVSILEGAPDGAEFSDANNIFRRKLLRKRTL